MSGATPARPKKNGQFEPRTVTSEKDCVCAVVCLCVERATAGRIRPNHADIRKWVLNHGGGRDARGNVRGLTLKEGADAAKALYGVTLTVLTQQNRDQVKNTVGNGRAVGESIDCRVTVNTARRTNDYGSDPSKIAGHLIYLHQYRWNPGGLACECELKARYAHAEFLVEDPGTTTAGYLWWSGDLVYRAGEKRTGGNGIQMLAAPDTEGVAWTCATKTTVRKTPSRSGVAMTTLVPGGDHHKGGRTENGDTWPRTNGSLADQWIHISTSKGWGWVPGNTMRLAAA